MARRSSGGRSASRSRPAARNPPQPAAHAPPPAPAQPGKAPVVGGLGAAVADGLAFGTGSAVAHRTVDAVMGPRTVHFETVTSSGPAAEAAPNSSSHGAVDACGGQIKALQDCLNNYGSDISKCQFYMDLLQECRRSSGATLGA